MSVPIPSLFPALGGGHAGSPAQALAPHLPEWARGEARKSGEWFPAAQPQAHCIAPVSPTMDHFLLTRARAVSFADPRAAQTYYISSELSFRSNSCVYIYHLTGKKKSR